MAPRRARSFSRSPLPWSRMQRPSYGTGTGVLKPSYGPFCSQQPMFRPLAPFQRPRQPVAHLQRLQGRCGYNNAAMRQAQPALLQHPFRQHGNMHMLKSAYRNERYTQMKLQQKRKRSSRRNQKKARQQQAVETMFAPPAPLLDNEFYMARAEAWGAEEALHQQQGMQPEQQQAVSPPPAPLLDNEFYMARAEAWHAEEAAVQQLQVLQLQSAISMSAAPATPAELQQHTAPARSLAVSSAPSAVQQLQSESVQQEDFQQEDDGEEQHYVEEEVCSWYPVVKASLKYVQQVGLQTTQSSMPAAPVFSVLTRTVSDAASYC